MRKLDERFRKCDRCKEKTNPPAAGVYYRNEDLWLCLRCPKEKPPSPEDGSSS
jgi:hypothetical protein